ncbi:CIA30 family protein [Salegentibacter flavus]|uniref:Complex I intermediate-associated protein 30 (CIA30) n=1 Tax=Salegentibacter flavus TaxID=287099 RepID=A0A1I5C1C7_9FLAO|nr:CIA30 family protein [Salegentibacter flavus]SFN80799.1 Complex I intermediate-associated protein 30 (CIA30) [Salegentibacter flavus]
MFKLLLFDFSKTEDWSDWETVNDGVMGGNSGSNLESSTGGNAIFRGSVSLENNGGFASLRYQFAPKDIQGYKKAFILLKGDGKTYKFRMKSSINDKASYTYTFETTVGWQTVEVPLKEMEPVFRGEKLELPNFSADMIEEIRFLIANKKAEDFRLEINKIELK